MVGENARLVATLEVRKASIRHPDGRSNVRMTESREVATSQRESGEKAWTESLSEISNDRWRTYKVKNSRLESAELSDYAACFYVDDTNDHVLTDNSQQTTISMQRDRGYCRG